ncbi:MAG: hypothetical protein WA738_03165 [Candidatus Angelobacter sp.]
MRKKILGICVLLAVQAAAWAQTGGDAGWSKYSNDPGKFSVMLPAVPEENSATDKGVLLHTFKVIQRPRMYMVIYSDYPDADLTLETSVRLKAERDGFLKGVTDGKLISEREFKFKRGSTELPALEFTCETANVTYKALVILDERRVYFACAGSIKGNDSTSQFERFLGSFTLN